MSSAFLPPVEFPVSSVTKLKLDSGRGDATGQPQSGTLGGVGTPASAAPVKIIIIKVILITGEEIIIIEEIKIIIFHNS